MAHTLEILGTAAELARFGLGGAISSATCCAPFKAREALQTTLVAEGRHLIKSGASSLKIVANLEDDMPHRSQCNGGLQTAIHGAASECG